MSADPPKDAKPAPPPPRRSMKSDDDDAKPTPPPRSGLLPTGLSRAIVIATLFGSAVYLLPEFLAHRYSLASIPRTENALVYRLDTLTGKVSICSTTQCMPLTEKE
jgi:hypothetical protein